MTPKKARWLMRRPWYAKWRIRKIRRQWGYYDQLLIENLTPSVGECCRHLERLARKEEWYVKRYIKPRSQTHA